MTPGRSTPSDSRPLSEKMADDLRRRIALGEFAAGHKLAPVRAMARNHGVNATTAARALTILHREGFLRTVPRLGVFVARGEKAPPHAQRIGLLAPVPPENLEGWGSLESGIRRIHQRLAGSDMCLSYHFSRVFRDRQWQYLPAADIAGYGLDGLLVFGIYDFHYLSSLVQTGIPIATFDVDASCLGADSAFLDNRRAASDLTRILLDRGHRSILCVVGPPPSFGAGIQRSFDPAALERADGYRWAMGTFAPELPQRVFHAASRIHQATVETVREALRATPDCTALLTEAPLTAAETGNDRIEVAGFRSHTQPDSPLPLTAAAIAEMDFADMAIQTCDCLLARLNEPARPVQRVAMMPRIRMAGSVSNGQWAASEWPRGRLSQPALVCT